LALVVPGIDDDPFPRPTWMLGHDRPAGIDLHHARTAAHFDTLAEPGKRNRIAARFERHRAILIHRPRHGDIEWLGQVRHRAQVSLLRFPSFFHRGPGGWADPAPRFFDHASVGPRLQLVPVRPVPGRDFLPLPVVLDPSFHFEPYRVFRRLHFEGGWSPWDDQAIFHQRSASERFGWFSSTATSTTRSGPRFARSPRRSDVRLSLCGGGLSKRNGTWESVRAWRRTNGNG